MAHVVVTALSTPGHARPLSAVAADLTRRGHDVVMTVGAAWEETVTASGVAFRALPDAALLPFDDPAWHAAKARAPTPAAHLAFWIRSFADAAPAQHDALQWLVRPDSVLVADMWSVGAWPILLGAPGIRPARVIGVNTSPLLGRGTPEGLAEGLAPAQAHLEAVLAGCGATVPVPFVLDAMVEVFDRAAQLCVAEFELPAERAAPGLRFVGPLPSAPAPASALPTWWAQLRSGRPVVLVTQGTVTNVDLTQLVVPTLEALADEDVLVVAALGGRDPADLPTLPRNARAAPFPPIADALPHVSVMVTNGGYGGVQAALRAGVPLVVAGAGEDKPAVAARVAAFGLGIDLGTERPSAARVGGAVAAVRGDPGYRAAARAMAGAVAGSDAPGALDALVREAGAR